MAVTSTPSFDKVYDDNGNEILDQFYSPANPLDSTVLTGSSFDTKIGYKFRSAAQQELYIILQDVEGTPLTDSSGEPLVSLIDGFVTSELTSEKALGIVLPTVPEEQQIIEFTLFGDKFDVRRRQLGADPETGGDIPPYVEVINPDGGFKYIEEGNILLVASGADIIRDGVIDGREFEEFVIDEITDTVNANGNVVVRFSFTKNPLNEINITEIHIQIIKGFFWNLML